MNEMTTVLRPREETTTRQVTGVREARRAQGRIEGAIGMLSRREGEVLRGIAFGLTNRQIADWLGISNRTVEIHRMHTIQKLGARNSADAVRIALTSGFRCENPLEESGLL